VTVETRTTIEPRDVLAIELCCATCGSRVRYPISHMQAEQFKRREHSCPNCGQGLLAEVNRVADLVNAVQTLIRAETKAIIRIEIANEAAEHLNSPGHPTSG
jgi:DNA-directed RNA polymerase subunit RPC12/RpoP